MCYKKQRGNQVEVSGSVPHKVEFPSQCSIKTMLYNIIYQELKKFI